MKNVLLFFLLFLFMEGVFGETDETLTVVKGDSVTLHTGVTKIESNDVIDWRFGQEGDRIARLNAKTNNITIDDNVLNGKFIGRLNVDSQTGDLTIRNIKTTDTGIYEADSTHTKRFSVTVVSMDPMQSVLVGEFVTLPTGLTDTQKYDVIRWRFGPQNSTIAEFNIKTREVSTFDGPGNRFKGRLQLTPTGSLTITNTGISHSGLYEVDIIRNSSYTIHKKFNVTVSGEVKSVSVEEGKSVTLPTDTELHIDDLILWMFDDTVIVSRSIYGAKQQFLINAGPDGIFRDGLSLDHKTGSLTITNIITKHAGDYKLQISSSRHTVNKKFIVNVKAVPDTRLSTGVTATICIVVVLLVAACVFACTSFCYRHKIYEPKRDVKLVSVNVTDEVPLEPGVTKTMQKHDVILWSFEGILIAGITGDDTHPYDDVLGGRFRDRLKLNSQTGSLTITNITTEHAGLYQASMMIDSIASFRSFKVTVFDPTASRGNGGEMSTLLKEQP